MFGSFESHMLMFHKVSIGSQFFYCWCREEAELEYLRVAQDLEMLGVNYFDITVRVIVLVVSISHNNVNFKVSVVNPQCMHEGYGTQLCLCICVTSTAHLVTIAALQLQSQHCLDDTLQCLNCFNFPIRPSFRIYSSLYIMHTASLTTITATLKIRTLLMQT